MPEARCWTAIFDDRLSIRWAAMRDLRGGEGIYGRFVGIVSGQRASSSVAAYPGATRLGMMIIIT